LRHASHFSLSIGRMDSRLRRTFSRLVIGSGKDTAPRSPPSCLNWTYFCEVLGVRDFPNEPASTIVGGDYKRIAVVCGFGLEICDLPKHEAINTHIIEDLEAVVDGCSSGSGDERRFSSGGTFCGWVNSKWLSFRWLWIMIHPADRSTALREWAWLTGSALRAFLGADVISHRNPYRVSPLLNARRG